MMQPFVMDEIGWRADSTVRTRLCGDGLDCRGRAEALRSMNQFDPQIGLMDSGRLVGSGRLEAEQ